jgi:hypothetical protein
MDIFINPFSTFFFTHSQTWNNIDFVKKMIHMLWCSMHKQKYEDQEKRELTEQKTKISSPCNPQICIVDWNCLEFNKEEPFFLRK